MRLRDKVCIVTGSSRGIGKGIVTALAKEGAKIVVNYNSREEEAKKTAREIVQKYNTDVEIVKADVSSEEEVAAMVQKTMQRYGTIDVLVNNAGIHNDSVVWKMDKAVWDEVISVNLTGIFLCTKHVVPVMREKGWGRIINVSSVLGQTGTFGACNYVASKSGIFGFTKAVAREVANKNITVNCVSLGYIEAGMNIRLSEEIRRKTLLEIPMKRFGKLEEVTGLIVFLCTEKTSYITGQIINISGGYYS